jgi:glycosyltransferase involved in cell wall biosynthesis
MDVDGKKKTNVTIFLDHRDYFRDLRKSLKDKTDLSSEIIMPKLFKQMILSKNKIIMKSLFNFFALLAKVPKLHHQSDFFICTGFHTIPFIVIFNLFRFKGKILITNFYLHAAGENQLVKKFLSLLFNEKIHLILQSPYEYRQYKNSYPNIQVYFIPYCQDEIQGAYPNISVEDQGYIFSGGYTNRDYDSLIKAAEKLPYHFVIACSRLNKLPQQIPGNVTVTKDISAEEFHGLLARAGLIVLNLKDQVGSSGQMVALAGLSFKKPILYSRNEAISHYFVDGKSGISYQMQDIDDLIKKIEFLMKNNKIRNEIAMEGYQIYANNFLERNKNDQILKIIFPS